MSTISIEGRVSSREVSVPVARLLLDAAYSASGAMAGACVLLICVLMLGQSLLRQAGVPTGATNEVVGWLCAGAAFLGMAHAFKHGDFVSVTLLVDKLPRPARRVFDVLALSVGCAAIGYLAWWATVFTYESWEMNDVASGLLPLPMWIPQSSFVAGAWLFLLAMADELVIVLRGGRPTYVVAVERRHAEGDFSSDL